MKIGEVIYKDQQANASTGESTQEDTSSTDSKTKDEKVVDAEYEEVDDKKEDK